VTPSSQLAPPLISTRADIDFMVGTMREFSPEPSSSSDRAPSQSLWWSSLEHAVTPRASLGQHLDVDVAIVGGGFTGLWTARELLRREPTLRVAVLEKEVCGFGASGAMAVGFGTLSHE